MAHRHRGLLVSLLALIVAAPAAAQSYRDGRIRLVERGVSLQRADESGAEEALANTPFLPGDRVWTDQRGRAEFQFADGTVLRLDRRSKLDYVARDQDRRADSVVLRLFSGSLFLHIRDGQDPAEFIVEAAGGVFTYARPGRLPRRLLAGEAELSVYEGEAQFDGADRVRVRAGERLSVRAGRGDAIPRRSTAARATTSRCGTASSRSGPGRATCRSTCPTRSSPTPPTWPHHGAWYDEVEVGHVWVPYVSAGWRPYSNGHWSWTAFGWTWVPYEPWGWAPFHYGRWGFSNRLGWYWIPGRTWGPAWVSWSVLGRLHRLVRPGPPQPPGAVPGGRASPAWRPGRAPRDGGRHRFRLGSLGPCAPGGPDQPRRGRAAFRARAGRRQAGRRDLPWAAGPRPAGQRDRDRGPTRRPDQAQSGGHGARAARRQPGDDPPRRPAHAVRERAGPRERERPRRTYSPSDDAQPAGRPGRIGSGNAEKAPRRGLSRAGPRRPSSRTARSCGPSSRGWAGPGGRTTPSGCERARPREGGDDRRAPGGYESLRKPRQESQPVRERPRVAPPPPPPPPPPQKGGEREPRRPPQEGPRQTSVRCRLSTTDCRLL